MSTHNPLKQYFRQPGIYVKLPSSGNFYPPGVLEMTANGEFPVFPMTARDEITYRTPDALFNGQAVVEVIQSCVPNIKNAWYLPSIDLDNILVAIRIASYGHNMEFTSQCPACNNEEDRQLDLRTVIDVLRAPDYSKGIHSGDLEIYFKPMTYKNLTDNNRSQYEEQRLLQQLPDFVTADDIELERAKTVKYGEALKKMTDLTIKALAQSIAVIKTPQAQVTEPEFILDFLNNCDRKLFNRISEHIINLKSASEIQPLKIECSECKHQYDQPITLNMTNFFADAS